MNRGLQTCGLLLLLVLGAVAALRHDLSQWRLTKADRAFHTGELLSAQAAWSSAALAQSTRQPALLNRGAARYRLGELAAASADFRAAAASDNPNIRQRALYNLGTTLLVMERERKSADRQEAERLLAEAVRQLQAAVNLNPADADADHNKAVAQARLSAVAGGTPAKRPAAESARQPQENGEQGAAAPKQPGQAGAVSGKPGSATNLDSTTGKRRAAPTLSPEHALRMLDDARGREALRSGVAAGNRQQKLTPPEKDW